MKNKSVKTPIKRKKCLDATYCFIILPSITKFVELACVLTGKNLSSDRQKKSFFSEENSENNKNVLVFNTSDNVIVQKYWKICLQLDLYHFLVHFIGVCSA